MKGFIKNALGMAAATGAIWFASGCGPQYHNVVDPCYPERYNNMARQEVNEGFARQIQNGHILDQTVWNSDFRRGTAELAGPGMQRLNYIVRRRPQPNTTVYVQTAQDVRYDPQNPDAFVEMRNTLDRQRIEAVRNYLEAASAGRNLNFNVVLHDPAAPDMNGAFMQQQMRTIRFNPTPQGTIPIRTAATGAGGT
ncbi:MAG: hypothetical protein KatS3mg105_4249 [Gemmatales bacterium]|nr:MAG: hypothetical protein KatS3mg105_4249 [Gemmatales bacterium]